MRRLEANEGVGWCGEKRRRSDSSEGEPRKIGKRLWCRARTTCVSFYLFIYFSAACVLQLGERQQKQRRWPPEAAGPALERRGPSYLSLSVNNSSSQRPLLCYFWPPPFFFPDIFQRLQINKQTKSWVQAWPREGEKVSGSGRRRGSFAGCLGESGWEPRFFRHLGRNPSRAAAPPVLMTG